MLRVKFSVLSLVLGLIATSPVTAQETSLSTLFTTEAERRVINANRYKDQAPKAVAVVEPVQEELESVRELIKEEVRVDYVISGVFVDREGSKAAWVNGKAYFSGDTMEDGSKITISGTTVIITTIDGNRHRGEGGDVLAVTYLKPVDE